MNIISRNKIPQPIFNVEQTPNSIPLSKNEVHPTHELQYILYCIAKCMNCQKYGNTKTCSKCGGNHTATFKRSPFPKNDYSPKSS